jgi:hypothetical protein
MLKNNNWAATLAIVVLSACSSNSPQYLASTFVKSQLVSANQGGTIVVSSADSQSLTGTSIDVPAHALATDTRIYVGYGGGIAAEWVDMPSSTASLAPAGATVAGPIVYIGPDGMTFQMPVTVTLPFARLSGTSLDRLVIDALEGNGRRYQVANAALQISGNLVTFQASGFTQFGADYLPPPVDDGGCSAGLTPCAAPDGGTGLCVDLTSDGQNCGTCSNSCASGICDGGGCVDTGGGATTTTTGGGTTSATSGTSTTGSGTTGGSTSGTTTGGTTGGALGGPYVPYDAGPRFEPPIDYDAGCTALYPISVDAGYLVLCVGCLTNSDCAPGLLCDNSPAFYGPVDLCVQCVTNTECPSGQVCNAFNYPAPDDWHGSDTCEPSCALDASICGVGFCESDSGICYNHYEVSYREWTCYPTFETGWCLSNNDCAGNDGGGACFFDTKPGSQMTFFPFTYNGFGFCVGCLLDGGGGCAPDQVCQALCPGDVGGNCVFNCFLDAGACGLGTYCVDAGPVGPDGGPEGLCATGCGSNANCGGAAPICLDAGDPTSGCVQCQTSADCPDWAMGCVFNMCDTCAYDSDCPTPLFCGGSLRCNCYLGTDCPLDVPVCVGGNQDAGIGGQCACTGNSDCVNGLVCEMRAPYGVISEGPFSDTDEADTIGGACIPACVTNADCALSFAGTENSLCDTATGFCVPCVTDQDCTANADPNQPYVNPKCVLCDGGYVAPPNAQFPYNYKGPPFFPGGGRCGCGTTSDCNGGYSCHLVLDHRRYPLQMLVPGTCGPPCTYANGLDSCAPELPYGTDFSPSLPPPVQLAFCNTETGSCQQCLDDYDCTNTYLSYCSDAGFCFQCRSGDDCAGAFPNNSCDQGFCEFYCIDSSACPTDGGYACFQGPVDGGIGCFIACVMGDDAGLGTVSDAGASCPPSSPLCVSNPHASDPTVGVCAQCWGAQDTTSCQPNGSLLCGDGGERTECEGVYLSCLYYCI